MTVLGISAYYHDSAAALITDGEIIAAAQEERFSRIKNDKNFPTESIKYCLSAANTTIDELDAVIFYDKPFLKFERLIETYYTFAPKGLLSFFKSIPIWINEKIFTKKNIRAGLASIEKYDKKKLNLLFSEHHLSHAASAFFPSGFDSSAILTIDGVGEWATTTICTGNGNKIEVVKELAFPHSIGLLYSAFTYYLGFTVNSDEYKLMGLAPYGNPESEETKKYIELITHKIVKIFDDGSVFLNQQYFEYSWGLRMTNDKKFEKLFGFKRKAPKEDFSQQHLNLAYAVQHVIEEIVIKLAYHAKTITGCENLCIAGGVGLNCVANGKLDKLKIFSKIFIQPAAGDAGGALGAALAAYHIFYDKPLVTSHGKDKMKNALLGPDFSRDEILSILKTKSFPYKEYKSLDELCEKAAQLLTEGQVAGWFQGRMEFGPRALGNRSILASTSYPQMQKKLNLAIKFREGFRPFAPVVIGEDANTFFEIDSISEYMLVVYPVKKEMRNTLPAHYQELSLTEKLYFHRSDKLQAITHVDGTARVQTVFKDTNYPLYILLEKYKNLSGMGILVNTSFNVKDEPIVCTPSDAISCFEKTDMNFLVIGNFMLIKP